MAQFGVEQRVPNFSDFSLVVVVKLPKLLQLNRHTANYKGETGGDAKRPLVTSLSDYLLSCRFWTPSRSLSLSLSLVFRVLSDVLFFVSRCRFLFVIIIGLFATTTTTTMTGICFSLSLFIRKSKQNDISCRAIVAVNQCIFKTFVCVCVCLLFVDNKNQVFFRVLSRLVSLCTECAPIGDKLQIFSSFFSQTCQCVCQQKKNSILFDALTVSLVVLPLPGNVVVVHWQIVSFFFKKKTKKKKKEKQFIALALYENNDRSIDG